MHTELFVRHMKML